MRARSALFTLALIGCTTTISPRDGELVAPVGPLDLPAASGGHGHGDMTARVGRWKVAESGFITSFTPAIERADGTPLPGELVHHVAIGERSRDDFLCTEHSHRMPHLILAAGGEMTRIEMPEGYGIPVERGAKLVGVGMFAGSTQGAVEDARFVAHMGFVKDADLRPIVPVWIDVLASCPEEGYTRKSSARDSKVREFSFPFDGELHLAGGHMHDGGRSLVLTRISDGSEVARFEPKYDGERISEIPLARFTPTVHIESNERYRLEATYEGHSGPAMGIVVAFVAPSG